MKIITRLAEEGKKPSFYFCDDILYNWGKNRQIILPDDGKILKIKNRLFNYGEFAMRIEFLFEEKVYHAFTKTRLPFPTVFDPNLFLYGERNHPVTIIEILNDFE